MELKTVKMHIKVQKDIHSELNNDWQVYLQGLRLGKAFIFIFIITYIFSFFFSLMNLFF